MKIDIKDLVILINALQSDDTTFNINQKGMINLINAKQRLLKVLENFNPETQEIVIQTICVEEQVVEDVVNNEPTPSEDLRTKH